MEDDERDQLEDRIIDLTKQVEALKGELDERDDVIDDLRSRIDDLRSHIDDINDKASSLYNFIDTNL